MQIQLISLFYSPEPVARPHDLATILKNSGHSVTVITGFPNYPGGKIYAGYRGKAVFKEEIDQVTVIRVPHYIDRSHSSIRRVFSYLSFALSALFFGLKIQKPDVIWTYQIGLPGALLSKLRGVPLVHEVQDLWPDWGKSSGLRGREWLYRLLAWQESFIYKNSQKVVTITNGFKNKLIQKGINPEKVAIISNWANETVFHPETYDRTFAQNEGFENYFNITYIGNIGAAQALEVIIDAAKLLQDIPDIRFVIIGNGIERPYLEAKVQEEGLDNVRFLGSREQDQAARFHGDLGCDVVAFKARSNLCHNGTIKNVRLSHFG